LALLLARDMRFKRLIRGAVLLPWVIPTARSTLGWWWMFDSLYSVVNWTAIRLGILSPPGPNWLGQSAYAMAAVITVNVWRGLPFFAITVLAGLVSIPREFHEAAEVDGAGPWGRFWHVTLPLLGPVLAFALFPFYFMLITSLKSNAELYNLKSIPFLVQTGVIADHYQYLFQRTEFLTWMKNSLIISVVATSASLAIAILAGYSLA